MKYLCITLTILLIGVLCASGDEAYDPFGSDVEPEPAAKISEFPEWTFCIAYNFRDADKRDSRPNPFKESSKDDYIRSGSLIIPTYMFDTAGLVSRTISQKKINKDSAQKLFDLTFKASKSDRKYSAVDCYNPHHIIIFYHDWGIPVGCIEVCFMCNEVKAYFREDGIKPAVRVYPINPPDFLAIATILDNSKLSLLPFKSLDNYKSKLSAHIK